MNQKWGWDKSNSTDNLDAMWSILFATFSKERSILTNSKCAFWNSMTA